MALHDPGRASLGSTELATRMRLTEVRSPGEPSASAGPADRPRGITQGHPGQGISN